MSKEVFFVDFTPIIPAILLRKPIQAPLFFSMQRIFWELGSRSLQIKFVSLSYAVGAIYARYRSVFVVYWNFLVEPAPAFCNLLNLESSPLNAQVDTPNQYPQYKMGWNHVSVALHPNSLPLCQVSLCVVPLQSAVLFFVYTIMVWRSSFLMLLG